MAHVTRHTHNHTSHPTSGLLFTWGSSSFGRLGLGSTLGKTKIPDDVTVPTQVTNSEPRNHYQIPVTKQMHGVCRSRCLTAYSFKQRPAVKRLLLYWPDHRHHHHHHHRHRRRESLLLGATEKATATAAAGPYLKLSPDSCCN